MNKPPEHEDNLQVNDALQTNVTEPEEPEKALTGAELIEDYVKHLPNKPGVYRMLGKKEDVLYVGKAKNLKKRVTSYTQMRGQSNRILRMISETCDMEFVVTATETEALLLEANLIKQLKPRYNVLLRDDKSFPHILIANDHKAPQILKHRGARKRPGQYYGPFASAGAVNRTLNTLQKAFLLRSCSDSIYESRTRPCLLHQIKRCAAPCVDLISQDDYAKLVSEARRFLSGEDNAVQKALSEQMEAAASALDFESAAAIRDRIRALSFIQESQDINAKTIGDADIFAAYEQSGKISIQVFFFRAGQNWGNHAYFPRHDSEQDIPTVMNAFMAQFYDNRTPPSTILTSHTPQQLDLLSQALSMKASRKVSISTPQRGEKKEVMASAVMNAKEALSRRQAEAASHARNLTALKDALDLDKIPQRIEVYDNSHIQGKHAVGGMIVAGPEGFEKNQYRKFNIKDTQLTPGDDFGMMREVMTRRFTRALKEQSFTQGQWPDLVIIDGGKGQLSAVLNAMADLGLTNTRKEEDNEDTTLPPMPVVVSIAKPKRTDDHGRKTSDRTMGAIAEQIFLPDREPFLIPPRDPALFYIQRLRDEAHRYAISAHQAKRKKAISANPLDDVPGVGANRKRALLNHFGSAKSVAKAKPQDLATVDGISQALAQRIYDYFHE